MRQSTPVWIALLRGINVGGNHKLPMKSLTAILQGCGCEGVQTYIQSGNAVFRSSSGAVDLAESIGGAIQAEHGFKPRIIMLAHSALQAAIRNNPFPEATENHKSLHFFFLSERPDKKRVAALDAVRAESEAIVLKGDVFYLHAPDGIGNSKLAGQVEKLLGVPATARNWRTVEALSQLAQAASKAGQQTAPVQQAKPRSR